MDANKNETDNTIGMETGEIDTATSTSNPVIVAQIGSGNHNGTDKDLTIFLYFTLQLLDGLNTIFYVIGPDALQQWYSTCGRQTTRGQGVN